MKTVMQPLARRTAPGGTVKAFVVNAIFVVHRHEWVARSWVLTHRLTGFSAGSGYPTKIAAFRCGRAITRRYGVKHWTFTDPMRVKGMKDAKAIIRKHGGFA